MGEISTISFAITTGCNRRCPDCCAGVGRGATWVAAEDYLLTWPSVFRGVEIVNIYGGEPMTHPRFGWIAAHMREWFPGSRMVLSTNGGLWQAHEQSIRLFDEVVVSHYGEWTYQGCPDNTAAIGWMKGWFGTRITVSKAVHLQRTVGKSKPCAAAHTGALEFRQGILYPCCTGSGADTPSGIVPDKHWREKILLCQPQCSGCPFAT